MAADTRCVYSVIIRCPDEVTPFVQEIVDLCFDRVEFDPNYSYDVQVKNCYVARACNSTCVILILGLRLMTTKTMATGVTMMTTNSLKTKRKITKVAVDEPIHACAGGFESSVAVFQMMILRGRYDERPCARWTPLLRHARICCATTMIVWPTTWYVPFSPSGPGQKVDPLCTCGWKTARFKERDDNVKVEILKATSHLLQEAVVSGMGFLSFVVGRVHNPIRGRCTGHGQVHDELGGALGTAPPRLVRQRSSYSTLVEKVGDIVTACSAQLEKGREGLLGYHPLARCGRGVLTYVF